MYLLLYYWEKKIKLHWSFIWCCWSYLKFLISTIWLVVKKNWIHCINFTSCCSVTRSLDQIVNLEFPSRITLTSTLTLLTFWCACSGLLPSLAQPPTAGERPGVCLWSKRVKYFWLCNKFQSLYWLQKYANQFSKEAKKCYEAVTKRGVAWLWITTMI